MNETYPQKQTSKWTLPAILFSFFVIGCAMFIWPLISLIGMLREISAEVQFITLDKGAYYLFGGGLFFLTLSIGTALSFKYKERVATRFVKYFGILLVLSPLMAFVLPQIVHLVTEEYLFDRHYSICEAKSTQWLHVRTIVYTKTLPCD